MFDFKLKRISAPQAERSAVLVISPLVSLMVDQMSGATGSTGTSAILLSLFARPDTKDFLEQGIQCVEDITLPQILQDLDSVAAMLHYTSTFLVTIRY